MDAVLIDPPAAVLAERRALGLDIRDEVWDGEYHMVPAASDEHQRIEMRLLVALVPACDEAGLELRAESNLIPPEESGWNDFRVPDVIVFPIEVRAERGIQGAASLVIEVRSPRDESFEKLPFYERLDVGEVLIIDRDTKHVRRWANGPGGLVETAPDAAGRHALTCLPVQLWTEAGRLLVDVSGAVTAI
jgi:Uma2 family endonuclease